MRARDLPRQRQAQPGPLDAAAQRIVGPVKLLEDFLFAALRHAKPAVKHAHFHVRQRLGLATRFHAHGLPIVGVFLGVRQEVHNDLSQRVAVAIDEQRRPGHIAFELESVRFEVRAIGLHRFLHDTLQVALCEIVFLFAPFDAREVEHVIDQASEAGGFGGNNIQI